MVTEITFQGGIQFSQERKVGKGLLVRGTLYAKALMVMNKAGCLGNRENFWH